MLKMMRNLVGVIALLAAGQAAASIAIVQGSFYTSNLYNNLVGAGETVTEISNYDAASLAAFDTVIHYGNTFTDTAALSSYVSAGGKLILTPWAGWNFAVPAELQVFDNGGSAAQHAITYPGVNVLDPGHGLLTGVTFPGPGGFDIGRVNGIGFVPGAEQIVAWADGPALFGTRSYGAGMVFGLNLQVITSDTAYQVIDQDWALQLILNAAGASVGAVPVPSALLLLGVGLVGMRLASRRRVA